MQRTPASLLQRLREPGQAEAWGRFVELYTPVLFAWARRFRLQEADAADLVQDVLLLLVRKLPEFEYDRGRRFRAWLWTLTRNEWVRFRQRRAPAAGGAALDDLPGPDPADVAGEEEYRRVLVARALQVMQTDFEPATWQACWQVVVDGRAPAAVAAGLGLTVGAVYAAKARVLRRLREELTDLLD